MGPGFRLYLLSVTCASREKSLFGRGPLISKKSCTSFKLFHAISTGPFIFKCLHNIGWHFSIHMHDPDKINYCWAICLNMFEVEEQSFLFDSLSKYFFKFLVREKSKNIYLTKKYTKAYHTKYNFNPNSI